MESRRAYSGFAPHLNNRTSVRTTANAKNATVSKKKSRSTFGSITMTPFLAPGPKLPAIVV